MKHLFVIALLFIASFASAQILNIPDAEFKTQLLNYTNPVIDVNGDGEIQQSEAQVVTKLYLVFVTDLTGIQSFTSLDTLIVIFSGTTVDLSGMTSLNYTEIEGYQTHEVNIANCSNLEILYLSVSNSNADSITSFNLTGVHKLRELYCDKLNLPGLDLSECDSLTKFIMAEGDIHAVLDVSGLTKLDRLEFEGHIGTLKADNDPVLKRIQGYSAYAGMFIDDISIINSPALESISGFNYYGTYLDLGNCPNLYAFGIGAPNLRYLNIKNGTQIPLSLIPQNFAVFIDNPNPLPLFICTDDFETADIIYGLNAVNPPGLPLNVNSFCTAWPGGNNYNTMQGRISLDANTNGCDAADPGIANIGIKVFDGTYNTIKYTNTLGNYRHDDFVGNFTLTPYFPYPYFTISPTSENIIFTTANNIIDTTDFCITATGIHNQVEVMLLPYGYGKARPGFESDYQIIFRNRGTTTLSGNVKLNFDNNKMSFSYANVAPSVQLPAELSWNYNNLMPFESRSVIVGFNIIAPPVNNIGDTIIFLATIDPLAGDEIPANNSFILPQRLVGAYDPNYKECLEGSKIAIDDLEKPLHYFIHFQNLGTDTAFNVIVTDTLTNNVDWESFDFVSSSHSCYIKRRDNKLEFYFENINLPYQSINDEGSNGFVAFQVKPKNTLVVGDSINNTSSIYFDFNLPVVTNKTTTIVSLFAPVPVKLEYFNLTSRNESNLLTWKVATTDLTTTFNIERCNDGIHFSNIGNITATAQRCLLPFNFTDDKPLTGKNYYRIKITDANGISFYSKILVTGKTRSGFEITSIVSNQNNTILYMNVSKDQQVQIKIIASDGRMVYSQSKTIAAGTNQLNLQTGNLSKGIYSLIAYTNKGEIITKRFVK